MLYYVVKTKFHGGGIVSKHRTLRAAKAAAKGWKAESCTCGCCGVVTAAEYDDLQFSDDVFLPYVLCK